jgi:DNA gyrase/topoisomerase IV subunit A
MRIVIDLRRDANPALILNQLYKYSQMQDTFAMNMVALVKGEPKILNLKQMIMYYIEHQAEVITRRIAFDLDRAKQRAHIYEGLKIAIDNIDEVIKIIRANKSVAEAKQALIERFVGAIINRPLNDDDESRAINNRPYGFSEAQAQAVVELPLGRLAGLEIEKIIEELERLRKLIGELSGILAETDRNSINEMIRTDLLEVRRRYGDERRTEILPNETEIFFEDLIEREECVVTMTEAGYIKRQPASVYQAQRRGGKGITAMRTKEDDIVTDMFASNSHDIMLMFTNKGKVYGKKCYEIPVSSRTSKGMNIVNLLELSEGEAISTIIPVSETDRGYLVMVTRKGVIKRMKVSVCSKINRNGKLAIKLNDGDELAFVVKTYGNDEIFIAATNGQGLKIHENAVRVMGRLSGGVRGLRLGGGASVAGVTINPGEDLPVSDIDILDIENAGQDDPGAPESETETETEIVDIDEIEEDEIEIETESDADAESEEESDDDDDDDDVTVDEDILTVMTVTKNGFGKRCEFDRFKRRNRGGKGMACHKISDRTGDLVGVLSVLESDDIMIITDDGTMIRTPVSGIPVKKGRGTGGVKVMRTGDGVSIKSVIRVAAAETDGDDEGDEEGAENYG